MFVENFHRFCKGKTGYQTPDLHVLRHLYMGYRYPESLSLVIFISPIAFLFILQHIKGVKYLCLCVHLCMNMISEHFPRTSKWIDLSENIPNINVIIDFFLNFYFCCSFCVVWLKGEECKYILNRISGSFRHFEKK